MAQTVNPTRMEMLRLRRRLVVARRGHKLLKDKLDGLMKDFSQYAKEYKAARRAVDTELPAVLKYFVLAEATSSRRITEDALDNTRQDMSITVKTRRIMSVVIPQLEVSYGEAAGGYSRIHTSPELDKAISGLKEFIDQMLRMAELEQTVRLLCGEIEKTRRRVNALEYVMIPQFEMTIREISMKLEENERGATTRLMKVKDMMAKRDA